MDIQPQTNNSINDDQELAKALAGINQSDDDSNLENQAANISQPAPSIEPTKPVPNIEPNPAVVPVSNDMPKAPNLPTPNAGSNDNLDDIKTNALTELKPLVSKLDLDPEEKFNTLLLLIRSTDDKSLIAPAHEATKNIPDEAKKAKALLDIIKEIDYFSKK